jgi:hypothetical protein
MPQREPLLALHYPSRASNLLWREIVIFKFVPHHASLNNFLDSANFAGLKPNFDSVRMLR